MLGRTWIAGLCMTAAGVTGCSGGEEPKPSARADAKHAVWRVELSQDGDKARIDELSRVQVDDDSRPISSLGGSLMLVTYAGDVSLRWHQSSVE